MADIITSKSTLHNVFECADGDTHIVTVDDPNDSVNAAAVQEWADFAINNNLFVGTKAGSPITALKSSKKIDATQTKVDLT